MENQSGMCFGNRTHTNVLFAFTSTAMSQAAVSQAPQLDAFAQKLLGVSDTQTAVWTKGARQGLIEVAPVNLPVNPPGDCNHYGWPVATMTKDTLIVICHRFVGCGVWEQRANL